MGWVPMVAGPDAGLMAPPKWLSSPSAADGLAVVIMPRLRRWCGSRVRGG